MLFSSKFPCLGNVTRPLANARVWSPLSLDMKRRKRGQVAKTNANGLQTSGLLAFRESLPLYAPRIFHAFELTKRRTAFVVSH